LARVDEDKVRKLTSELRKALSLLYELQSLSKDEFLADEHKKGSAKYHFIMAIEAAVDLCNHLISVLRLRSPESYADTFKVLEEAGAFKKTFGSRLVEMAKFRNRLVHFYFSLNDDLLYEILQGGLKDLERFLKDFGEFLKKVQNK